MTSSSRGPLGYILLVERPGWRDTQSTVMSSLTSTSGYMRSDFNLPAATVPRGTLVEIDPLCLPHDPLVSNSVNVVSLDDREIKATLLLRNEAKPLMTHQLELLRPLKPQNRFDIVSDSRWSDILETKVGDTVWYYRSSKAASVAAKSRANGSFGSVQNRSEEKDVGFVRYVGPVEGPNSAPGFFIGVEIFLDPNRGNSNGTFDGKPYFEAPDYSSVFTTVGHIYFYDGDEDIEQVRQKIGHIRSLLPNEAFEDFDHDMGGKTRTSKKTAWRKFEADREQNRQQQERVLQLDRDGGHADDVDTSHGGSVNHRVPVAQEHMSYVEKVRASLRNNNSTSVTPKSSTTTTSTTAATTTTSSSGNNSKNGSVKDFRLEEDALTPPLGRGDRVVYISDSGPEYAIVKWLGHIPDETGWVAGVEFENPIGSGCGKYRDVQYFHAKTKHASFVPLEGLMKAEDLDSNLKSDGDSPRSIPIQILDNFNNGNEEGWSSVTSKSRRGRVQAQVQDFEDNNNQGQRRASPKTKINTRGEAVTVNDEYERDAAITPSCPRDPYASEDFVVEAEVHKTTVPESIAQPQPVGLSRVEDQFEQICNEDDSNVANQNFERGTLVELRQTGSSCPAYGVIRWIGRLPFPDHKTKVAGIELEEVLFGASNGWHQGSQLFKCPDRKAVFLPFTHFTLDKRFGGGDCNNKKANSASNNNHGDDLAAVGSNGIFDEGGFGDLDCPVVPGFQPPIRTEDILLFYGRNHGIQGHNNSCYLDATLFVMFSFTSVFDCLLYRPPNKDDIKEYGEVQRVLREEIVNPLRKNWFVRADRVMKLRQLLDSLTSVKGLLNEEKDPEELLNSLLSQTLKAEPFLELSSGQTAHLYQLFVERDETKRMPSVQELFEQSFLTSGVKLKSVPSVMILQMPRFGRQFKVYDRILPSQLLDVTDVIENAPRQCIVCGQLAVWECKECFGNHSSGLDSIAFCETCLARAHSHAKRRHHKKNPIQVPDEFLNQRSGQNTKRLYMELFAVMCIETSHYVSFVKCGIGPDAPWCFFDSMADRQGEQNGYNIPEVTAAPNIGDWLTEDGVASLNSCAEDRMLPAQAKRLICDGYMCFYQSPDVMMYQ